MKFHRAFLFLIFLAFLFSCKPQQKLAGYLQNVTDSAAAGPVKVPELLIQKGDVLSIQIMSQSTKPGDDPNAIYNQPVTTGTQVSSGYLVDNNGNILHHRLGLIHAEGLTKEALASEIRKRLMEPVALLTEPTVVIQLTNFKITVLGQVGHEGLINVPGEKVTIFEAIGMAGGINDYGKKTDLKILRELNGKREMGRIDLSSKEIFNSPYYYLAQNDVLLVDETNKRLKETEQTKIMQKISFAFTLVTVAATMANLFIKN